MDDVIRSDGRTLDSNDVNNLLFGTCFLASGGGGSIVDGIQMAKNVKYPQYIVPPSIIPDSWRASIIADIGSPDALHKGYGMTAPLHAYDDLAEYCLNATDLPIKFIVPVELGAVSTLIPFLVSSNRDSVFVVDGDPCGRAVPQLSMTMFNTANLPVAPIVLTSDDTKDKAANRGDHYESFVWVNTVEDAETCARCAIGSPVYNEVAGLGCYLVKGSDLKSTTNPALFPLTVSCSVDLGAALQAYPTTYKDASTFLTRYLRPKVQADSYLLVTGTIKSKQEKSAGFDVGQITLAGEDGYEWVISYMNESLYIQRNGSTVETHAIGPDLICYMAEDSQVRGKHIVGGQAFSNADIASSADPSDPALIPWGTRVSVFGVRCQDPLRKNPLSELFNSAVNTMFQQLGVERPLPTYVPVEDLNS